MTWLLNGLLDWLIYWLPWLAVAAIPGGLNLFVAFWDLDEKCRLLPFFQPLKVPGVWLWAAIQFALPIAMFWIISALSTRPAIDLKLLGTAVLFGVGFVVALNATVEIGAQKFNIKKRLYDPFMNIAFDLIARNQSRRAAEFWTDVETELGQLPDLKAGLRFLENYFMIREQLKPQPSKRYAERLKQAAIGEKSEQAKAIKSLLMEVSRRDLLDTLSRFQCSDRLLKNPKYFPKASIKVLVGHRR